MLSFPDIRARIAFCKENYRSACKRVKEETEAVEQAVSRLNSSQKALEIVQSVGRQVQDQVRNQIVGVVSKCLEAVFDDPYEFVMAFEHKRNQTEVRLAFKREGKEVDPMTAAGGGVIDVASFALRLACLMLVRPKPRKILIMDEPFQAVSPNLHDRVRELLEVLSEDMGVQFIMITNIPELATGKIIRVDGS